MTSRELIDIGAQAERTALAWQRTGIGMMAVGALLVRWAVHEHVSVWPGILLTVAAGIGVLVLVPERYHRILRTVGSGETPLSRATVPVVTFLVTIVILGVAAELAVRLAV